MRKRSADEMAAYCDGYSDSFNQFCECLKAGRSMLDGKRRMEVFVDFIKKSVYAEGGGASWEYDQDGGFDVHKCSSCGFMVAPHESKKCRFCPGCGTRMEET